MSKLRCRRRDSTAAPQAWGSGQGRYQRSNRNVKGVRSWYALRRLHVKGEGIRVAVLFLSATSWFQSVGSGFRALGWVPGETHRALQVGWDSGWGAASRTHERLSRGENTAGSVAASPSSSCRSDQLPSPDGCPAAGGVSSEPLNGARRKRDLNTPTAGQDRGRRT